MLDHRAVGQIAHLPVIEPHGGIEVHQVDRAPLIEQHVARLQVAIQDAASVDVLKPAGDFHRDPENVLDRQARTGFPRARDAVQKGSAGEVTTDHDSRFPLFPVILRGRDVRMIIQLPQHSRFPRAHGQPVRHDRVAGEDINHHQAVKHPVVREIDALVRSEPQEPLNLVPSSQDVPCLDLHDHSYRDRSRPVPTPSSFHGFRCMRLSGNGMGHLRITDRAGCRYRPSSQTHGLCAISRRVPGPWPTPARPSASPRHLREPILSDVRRISPALGLLM